MSEDNDAPTCPRCGQPSSESLDGMAWCPHCNGAHRWLKGAEYEVGRMLRLFGWVEAPGKPLRPYHFAESHMERVGDGAHMLQTLIADPPELPPYVSRPCPCGLKACMCERGR